MALLASSPSVPRTACWWSKDCSSVQTSRTPRCHAGPSSPVTHCQQLCMCALHYVCAVHARRWLRSYCWKSYLTSPLQLPPRALRHGCSTTFLPHGGCKMAMHDIKMKGKRPPVLARAGSGCCACACCFEPASLASTSCRYEHAVACSTLRQYYVQCT